MKLSKRTEYAVRALVHLARLGPDQYVQSRDLARQEAMPTKFLESVLLGLKRAGYLESKVGSGGGYRLARPAREITIAEVLHELEALESDPADARSSELLGLVGLRILEERLDEARASALEGLTLDALADEVGRAVRSNAAMYYI